MQRWQANMHSCIEPKCRHFGYIFVTGYTGVFVVASNENIIKMVARPVTLYQWDFVYFTDATDFTQPCPNRALTTRE